MNKFIVIVAALLGSSTSVMAVKYFPDELSKAGFKAYQCRFTRAWYNDSDPSNKVMAKLDKIALRALSDVYKIDLFDEQNMKEKVTVEWIFPVTSLSGQGKLDLHAEIKKVIVNKDKGIQFTMSIQEGVFTGEAKVTLSEKALTPAGNNFLKSIKSK